MKLRYLIHFIIGFSLGMFSDAVGGIGIAFCLLLVISIIIALIPDKTVKIFNRPIDL